MAQVVTFWVPELFHSLRLAEAEGELKEVALPGLLKLLAKADAYPTKAQSFFETASYLFHQPHCLPIAATQGINQLDQCNQQDYWLKADPVQLVADRDSLVLIPAQDLQLTLAESKALIQSFNAHFANDGVQLQLGDRWNWYLSLKQPIDLQTHALPRLHRQAVNDFFPAGHAAQYWRQLINEAQMLFYTHEVNVARREHGMPEINSIWVWGEGALKTVEVTLRQSAQVFTDNAYVKGMAQLAQAKVNKGPSSYFAWQDNSITKPEAFIVLEAQAQRLEHLNLSEYVQTIQELEKNWFAPLYNAVKNKQIDALFIDVGLPHRYHLTRKNLQRFWRLKKSLSAYNDKHS